MIEIIPAIDLIDGKCVRLSKGDFEKKVIYSENPLETAKSFEDAGVKRLHVVDLDGAKTGKIINYKTLEKITNGTKLIVDYGGGIKTDADIKLVFECGAKMVSIGSTAFNNKSLFESWVQIYGANSIIPGADVKDGIIVINGWTKTTDINVFAYIQYLMDLGIDTLFCTDVNRDGLLEGPATDLYKKLISKFNKLKLIASGGVSCFDDILKLDEAGCHCVIVGKAIYEGKITLKQIKNYGHELNYQNIKLNRC